MSSIAYHSHRGHSPLEVKRGWLVFALAVAATFVTLAVVFLAHTLLASPADAAPALAGEAPAVHLHNGKAQRVDCVSGQVAYVDRADTARGCAVTVQSVAAGEYRAK